jgi:hypothetical protein
MKMRTLLDNLDAFPPFFIRAVALRQRGRGIAPVPFTNKEMAEYVGISEREVLYVLQSTSWRGVRVEVVSKFFELVKLDVFSPHRRMRFFRRQLRLGLPHLDKRQRAIYERLKEQWTRERMKLAQPEQEPAQRQQEQAAQSAG